MNHTPNLELDQHFLIDKNVLFKIVKAGKLSKEDKVLEIGPGKGALTRELAKRVKKVIAIEKDETLKPNLLNLPKNTNVYYKNALEVLSNFEYNKVIANIPYAITEPLIKKLIKQDLEKIVLLTGEGFVKVLNSKSKWAKILPLSYEIEIIAKVSKEAFYPKPKTISAVISLTPRKEKLTQSEALIRNITLQDDKKVKNALVSAVVYLHKKTKKEAKEFLKKLDLPEDILTQNVDHLSNEEFEFLCKKIESTQTFNN